MNSRGRQHIALHSFNTVLKVFATALKQEREIKGLKTGKEGVRRLYL